MKKTEEPMLDVEEDVSEAEEKKVDQFPKKYTLRDKYASTIAKNLPKNLNVLKRYVGKYRQINIHKLETPYPNDYPIFRQSDREIFYKVSGVDMDDFANDTLNIEIPEYYTVKKAYIKDKSMHVLSLMILREMYKANVDDKMIAIYMYYLGYSYYWEQYTVFFKSFNPDKRIVEYTINNLSSRYMIRKCGSVDSLIYYAISTAIARYKERIINCADYEIMWVSDRISTRLRGYVKSFANPIHENSKKKNMIFSSKQIDSEGKQIEMETNATVAMSLADQYTTSFMGNPPSEKWLDVIAKKNGVSVNDLRNTIYIIKKEDFANINKFYQAMFYIFLVTCEEKAEDIRSTRFIVVMDKVYKKGNSDDKNIKLIKSFLHKWLQLGSATYRTSNRAETLNKFKRSIFEYFVYTTVKR